MGMIRILLSDTLPALLAPEGVDDLCDTLSTSLNAKTTKTGLQRLAASFAPKANFAYAA